MFRDRHDAGRQLAAKLSHCRVDSPVVLGLPRGGVVVASEVAAALNAPFDVMVVRKIGAPHQPELALGAVTGGLEPRVVLNEEVLRRVGVDRAYLDRETATQLAEVRRREQLYRGGRPSLPLADRTVIIVDDGIATGATVKAAAQAVAAAKPRRLILAVPVATAEALRDLRALVDGIVCLESPSWLHAVGELYDDFTQTSDDEVIALLAPDAAAKPSPPGAIDGEAPPMTTRS